ncbi:MAG: hydroxymethylbilane synthase [Bacteroidales bacterium]|nr:hydroxymethylbilane synthase [Bacteroidales bacterium]
MKTFKVATRPSLLAYTQTKKTVDLLEAKNPHCHFEIIKISTLGDKVADKALTSFGGTGVFVKELENALMNGLADFAVHSLKDVPSNQPEGLILASFPLREDPRDVVLTKNNVPFSQLPDNCIIGTGSPRRILQLKLMKPQARFRDLRGNIDTRLSKLQHGEYDAIVLAAAGLNRIGKTFPEASCLSIEDSLPAIGQGAIAIECRQNDQETIGLLNSINDLHTEISVTAERSFMKTIGGGCKFPLGAYAFVENNKVCLHVMIGDHHTAKIVRLSEYGTVEEAAGLGNKLAEQIKVLATEADIIIPDDL